jgi:hypothetical protein
MAKKPAVTISEFTLEAGTPASAPVPGVAGFVAYQPLSEVVTQGLPPVRPTLIARVRTPLRRAVMRTASGAMVTRPVTSQSRGRSSIVVTWNPLSRGERETLIAWARDILLVGEQGGRFGFLVQLEGAEDTVTTPVRPTQPWEATVQGLRRDMAAMECEVLR